LDREEHDTGYVSGKECDWVGQCVRAVGSAEERDLKWCEDREKGALVEECDCGAEECDLLSAEERETTRSISRSVTSPVDDEECDYR
jgi:hypothetical protein